MNILKLLKPKAVIDYVYSDCTVRQAIEKMRNHGFTAIPVINRDGEYVKAIAADWSSTASRRYRGECARSLFR